MKEQPIDHRTDAALTRFFGPLRTVFERSTFGAQLHRMELYAHGSHKCRPCNGTGITEPRGDWCLKCGGTGVRHYRISETSEQLTVRVNESRSGSGYVPSDEVMTFYAVMSRRVGALQRVHQAVLEAYFGDAGIRCSSPPCWRLVSVFALTPPGSRLVKLGIENLATEEERLLFEQSPPYERVRRHVELDSAQTKPHRKALIDAANEHAARMLSEALDAFGSVARGAA